jgi:hypothetical protein
LEWRKRGAVPPDKPGEKVGEQRCGPQVSNVVQASSRLVRKPSHSNRGEGSIGGGRTLADSRSRFRRGKDGSTQRRVALELVKPSWSRGETPRSKVGAGNGVEGQRVAAGSVGVKNRR